MLSAQASGAQVEPFLFALYNKGSRVNIWQPAPVGVALRVAYIMTELR